MKVCITGINGQTGSYLAEQLLEEGHEVYGLIRRSSTFSTERIDHIYDNPKLKLIYGDLSDYSSILSFVGDVKPDYFYNLAAQSHVRVSFDIPEYTLDITGTGVIRCLEAIRKTSPKTRFLQASSSEIFGSTPPPQNETTPFNPRSPYAVAKLAGYWATVNYREAYGLFACNSVSFNHETVADFMPVIFMEDKIIDIKPISEVVINHADINFDQKLNKYQEGEVKKDLYLWDMGGWTKVKFASGYPHEGNKNPIIINARNACYMTTDTHVIIMDENKEKEAQSVNIGDKVSIINYPESTGKGKLSLDEAELLGFIAGDGSINKNIIKLTSKNKADLFRYENIWKKLGGQCYYYENKSGFDGSLIWNLNLKNNNNWVNKFDIYDSFGNKRIPKIILNSSIDVQRKFLEGYNHADGLKANPCNYEFKNFKTNSATLAAGLLYLINNVTKQQFNLTVEESFKWGKRSLYYSINLLSDNKINSPQSFVEKYNKVIPLLNNGNSVLSIYKSTGISCGFITKVKNGYIPTGKSHLEKPKNEVKKIINMSDYNGWFFDLETESGTFHCGVGPGCVHNSPRRGETFVTRKITRAAARIRLGLQDSLKLGNLSAKRDWTHAADVARAMRQIINLNWADDFVIGSGEMHSVQDFLELVFSKLGLNWKEFVEFDSRFLRPAEVDALCADNSKITKIIGWKPEISFEKMVDEMIEHDMKLAEEEKIIKERKI